MKFNIKAGVIGAIIGIIAASLTGILRDSTNLVFLEIIGIVVVVCIIIGLVLHLILKRWHPYGT